MRILIVKTSSLGDIIHVFPVIAFLSREFPQAKIDWVVEKSFSTIVKAHPLVNKVIEIDTKGWRKGLYRPSIWREMWNFRRDLQQEKYDVVIDLQGNTKSAIPTFFSRSVHKVGFGLKTIHEWPNLLVTHHRFDPPLNLNVRDENLYVVQQYFQRFGKVEDEKVVLKLTKEQQVQFEEVLSNFKDDPRKKILVCPGSAWKNKQLTSDALESFLAKISEHFAPAFIFAWGTPEEHALVQNLQIKVGKSAKILEKLPLPVLQNLMVKVDSVIAMDSLPLHLAGTSGTPTFSVFGASSANKYMPKGAMHKAVQGPCPYGRVLERRCPVLRSCPTGLCIRGLSGEELFKEYCQGFY